MSISLFFIILEIEKRKYQTLIESD